MSVQEGVPALRFNRPPAMRGKPHNGLPACPVCTSADLEYAFVVDRFPVCQCQSCSLLFLNPQPPESAAPLPSRRGGSQDDRLEARRAIERLKHYSRIEVRNLLIIQTEAPFLEVEARDQHIDPVVLPAGDALPELDLLPDNEFDACVIFGRLEQTSRPQALLVAVRRVLKAEAALLINTASIDSMPARLLRNRWWEFSSRSYFYFGVNTLQNLLLKTGFREPLVFMDERDSSNEHPSPIWARWRGGILLRLLSGTGRISKRFIGKRMRRYVESRLTIVVRPKESPSTPRLSVIVPVYNERATFSQLIELVLNKQIEDVDIEIIIVESNSTDGTREDVLKCGDHPRVKVVLEEKPWGKGHAVRAGLQHATGDVILIQDADLEYDINEYEALVWPILSYEQNFVIGSRHNALGRAWKIRKFSDSAGLSHLFNLGHVFFLTLFNRMYGQSLADPFSMFKVFRRDCLYGLEFECNRFDFDFEIAIKLIRKGYKPIEIPINYQSRSIADGKKVTLIRDPLTWLRALVRFRRSPLYGRGAS